MVVERLIPWYMVWGIVPHNWACCVNKRQRRRTLFRLQNGDQVGRRDDGKDVLDILRTLEQLAVLGNKVGHVVLQSQVEQVLVARILDAGEGACVPPCHVLVHLGSLPRPRVVDCKGSVTLGGRGEEAAQTWVVEDVDELGAELRAGERNQVSHVEVVDYGADPRSTKCDAVQSDVGVEDAACLWYKRVSSRGGSSNRLICPDPPARDGFVTRHNGIRTMIAMIGGTDVTNDAYRRSATTM